MVLGKGSTTATLTTGDVQQLLASAYDDLLVGAGLDLTHKRVLVIIPDGTRTAPVPLMFRLLYEQLGRRVAQLDYVIALGTHPPMSQEAIDQLVGATAAERAERYPNVRIFNHEWHNPRMLQTIGIISRSEVAELSGGLLVDDVPVTLNCLIFEYDLLLICGPVFPHEVAGFSGGAKYRFHPLARSANDQYAHHRCEGYSCSARHCTGGRICDTSAPLPCDSDARHRVAWSLHQRPLRSVESCSRSLGTARHHLCRPPFSQGTLCPS